MANFGLGLSQGFQLGTQFGEAMRRKRMRDAFEEAQADKQFRKYTPAQGEQMRREAAMVDEFGNPLYEFSIEPGSTQYTRREIRYPGGLSTGVPEMSYAPETAAEEAAPARRSLGTMYRVPTGTMGLSEDFAPDTTGETLYEPQGVSAAPATRGLAQRDLRVSGEERMYTPDLSMVSEPSRVQQRLSREYGDSMTYTPGATQYLGQTYGAEGLTPAQQRAALMNRYADIISKYESPVEGERFRSMARAEERAEETYGLTKQMAKLGLSKAEREEKAAIDTENVYKAMGEYQEKFPNATPMEIYDHLKKQKLSTAAINKVVADIAGVGENELKMYNTAIDKIITKTGGSYAALKNAYNTNDMLDPTTNIVDRKTKDGKLVVDFVSADDPNKVLSSFTFNDETEAAAFLATNAKNPVVAAEMLVNTRYKRALTRQAESRSDYLAGGGARRGTGRDYSRVEDIQETKALMQYRDSLSKDVDRKRDQLNNMRKDDPLYKALQQDIINLEQDVFDLDREIKGRRGGGLRRDGGAAAPERYEPGKVYSFRDEKGNVKDYRLKEGKTGAAPEDWEEAKAAPAPKAEAKAEPAPKAAPKAAPKKEDKEETSQMSPETRQTFKLMEEARQRDITATEQRKREYAEKLEVIRRKIASGEPLTAQEQTIARFNNLQGLAR